MSGISLNYHIDMEQPVRAFEALGSVERLDLMNQIGELVLAETMVNFELEQAPDGTPWSPSLRDGKTLQDAGHLRDSITYLSSTQDVEIGSSMEYAAIHQFGGEAGRKNARVTIEARPYLGITADMQVQIGDLVIDFYDEVMNRVN